MTIAVTAASGRLGHATLRAIRDNGEAAGVIGVARQPDRIDVAGVEKRAGDYQSESSMTAALTGVDVVVMISAPVVTGTDRVSMQRNVIKAAQSAGVRKLVFTSVIGGPGEEQTMFYETQKVNRQTEEDIRASQLQWIIARNGLYSDLDLQHIVRAAESGVYRNNGRDGRCGYISVDEIAAALARLAIDDTHNGKMLNITSENPTQAELIEIANEVFSINVRYEPMTAQENIDRFMADPEIGKRGIEVARMLSGCFECVAGGIFDVPSDFAAAAGRAPQSVREQFERQRDLMAGRD